MIKYDDKTDTPIMPQLPPHGKIHWLVPHDESGFNANDVSDFNANDVSDFIVKETGRLALSPEQLAAQLKLPPEQQLEVTDAHKIIHP
jgi:hypothetical protein